MSALNNQLCPINPSVNYEEKQPSSPAVLTSPAVYPWPAQLFTSSCVLYPAVLPQAVALPAPSSCGYPYSCDCQQTQQHLLLERRKTLYLVLLKALCSL